MSTEPRLRILIVGASGTLGRAVAAELGARHEIVTAGRSSGDVRIDLTDPASIEAALAQAGKVTFAPLADFKAAAYGESLHTTGIADKLLGQVNLALAARAHLNDGGSITLTTGILTEQPIALGSSASLVNGAVEAFVRAAAIELPRGLRINAVSPTMLAESMAGYGPFFRGFAPVTAARAALAFSRSVEGRQTGQIYKIFE